MQQRSRSGIGLAIEETEFWVGRSVFARLSGTPARLVFSHHCTHNLATHLGRSCLAKPVLNCAANEVPAVTTGTPCQAMWQPWTDSPTLRRWGRRLNHPLTRYFLLQPATESHSIEESQKVLLERPGKANVSWNAGFCGRWQGSVWLHLPDQRPACRQARTEEKATACTPSIAYHVTCLPAQTGFRTFWKFLPCMRPRLSHCTNYLLCVLDNKLKLTWQW